MKHQKLVDETISERAKIYGAPIDSHTNIGLAWTGMIQQHYDGLRLPHPITPALAAQMMAVFKLIRSGRTYHADNYIDLAAYAKFAEEFQKEEKK